ncbi:MAG: hypothetical protein IJX58_01900 [Clostridia bacterium]|nr:hypothetical protein [Clostridia bacterium]
MKKTTTLFVVVSLILTLCFGLSGCKLIFPDEPVHTHSFTEGKCECGESDPDYNPPHRHSFVGGKCACGEIDPNHECIFFEGKCIICLKDDPNPNYKITGSYGVITEVVGNCEVVVDTVDVKSEEYENISLVLEEGNVNILDKAWVVYNVTVQPENEESGEKVTTGKVSVPAPVPGVEEYVVYEVQETEVEEVEYEYINDYIVVNTWNYNYNYLVTTEQSFNVVEYYEKTDTQIPEHINVGEDKAEDAYQKGQTRTLEVYACINGLSLADDEYAVSVEGHRWTEYNQLGKELYYRQIVYLNAQPYIGNPISHEDFIGWFVGDFNEAGEIVLEDVPYYTDLDFEFEMPAKDLKLFAVYAHTSRLTITGNMSRVSVDGIEFYDYVTAKVHPLQKYITLSAQPLENCYFSYWAYADDPYNPDCFISNEPTFAYEIPAGELREIVAICEPYSKYEYSVYSVCSDPSSEDAYAEYGFIVNGEDYNDDYYSGTFWEYETFSITAVSVKGCKFVGWAVISLRENDTYDSCKDKISSTDATYIINKDNCSTFKNNKLVAVYEMLPQYKFEANCYFIDDNYGSFASINIDGEPRGDNFYSTSLAEGEQVTIKAVPEMNCRFEGWYYYTVDDNQTPIFGDLASADPEFTFTMGTEDTCVIAKLRCYPTYSIGAYAGAGGDIYINGVNHYGSVRHAYEEGEKLTLKVEVKEGFEFVGWYAIGAPTEQLITTDLQFEYTVGSSDADFEARLVPIIYYDVKLEIKSPALTVDIDDNKDLPYIPETEVYRVYVTSRREGDSVTIRANDVEGTGLEFSHWSINGERISDREYTFTVGTEEVVIYAYAREKISGIELRFASNDSEITPIYSTDYETGERYLSGITVKFGAFFENYINTNRLLNCIRVGIIREGYDYVSYYYSAPMRDLDVDFDEGIEVYDDGMICFKKVGIFTVTVTDKSNPELSVSFNVVVEGYDETGTYVWVSGTDRVYHLDPYCSDLNAVTIMTKDDAEEAGYEPCSLCHGN